MMSQGSSVIKVTDCVMDDGVWYPMGAGSFSLRHRDHTGRGGRSRYRMALSTRL